MLIVKLLIIQFILDFFQTFIHPITSTKIRKESNSIYHKFVIQVENREELKDNDIQEGGVKMVEYNFSGMKKKELDLIINIHRGTHPKGDAFSIRTSAVEFGIPYITTVTATKAAVNAIKALVNQKISVNSLEEYYTKFEGK